MTSINTVSVPVSPAFLDPLIEIDSCYYYTVPRFSHFHHPNTRWLITMMKVNAEDRVKRKLELNPDLFKRTYFQMIDYPRLYFPDDPSLTPMFKRQTVLYLTALGMALYLRSIPIVDLMLSYKDSYDQVFGSPNEPQFASHLQDLKYGDFHAFPPCVIMLRMQCFESTVSLLKAGWNPTQPLAMPMRRKFERRAFYFFDWLELALGLLSERALYPLQSLILNMTRNMTLYKYLMLPTTSLLPPTPKDRIPTGLIDVEDLPFGTKMTGVRSLLDVSEDYDRFLQMRSCSIEVAALKREAVAVGLNPEILMIQALDYDGYVADKAMEDEQNNNVNNAWRGGGIGVGKFAARHWNIQHDTLQQAINANNSATDAASAAAASAAASAAAAAAAAAVAAATMPLNTNVSAADKTGGKKPKKRREYVGEGCRVMYYAMEKDKASKRMQVCLDSVIIMIKRGFYVNGERLADDSVRARDLRNLVVLLLNMIQREQAKLDVIFAKIQSGYKKFPHLEVHKMLENRRLACGLNIAKMIAALARLLMQSKELVAFVSTKFPPYHQSMVDFKINRKLEGKYNDVKSGVIQEFNSIKDGWTYLNKDMLHDVAKIKSMQLHFKVGAKPSPAELLQHKKDTRKFLLKNKPQNKNNQNMSNTNSCFVTFRKVQTVTPQQRQSPSASTAVSDAQSKSSFGVDCVHVQQHASNSAQDEQQQIAALVEPAAADKANGADTQLDFYYREKNLSVISQPLSRPPLIQNAESQQEQQQQQQQQQMFQLRQEEVSTTTNEAVLLMGDVVTEYDSLSETGLLMSSLCREVQDMLRPRGEKRVSRTSTAHNSKISWDKETIEPEPGCRENFAASPYER